MIAIEDQNSFDLNAVKITNRAGVFVGHIAVNQSHGFRSMLRESTLLDIQVQANCFWTEKEIITKHNSSRYHATRVVTSIHYSALCNLDLYDQKVTAIIKAADSNGFLFFSERAASYTCG